MQWRYISDWSHLSQARPVDPAILPKLDQTYGKNPHAPGEIDQAFLVEACAERFGVEWVVHDLVPHKNCECRPFTNTYSPIWQFSTPDGVAPWQRVWVNKMPKTDGSEDIYGVDDPVENVDIFRIPADTQPMDIVYAEKHGPLAGQFPRRLYKDLSKFERKAYDAYTDLEYSTTNVFNMNAGGNWQALKAAQYFDNIAPDTACCYQWMRTGLHMDDIVTPSDAYLDAQKSMSSPRNLLWTPPFEAPAHKTPVVVEMFYDVTIKERMPDSSIDGFTRFGYARQYVEGVYDADTRRVGVSGTLQIGRAACIAVVEKIFPGWGQLFAGQGVRPPDGFYRMCTVDVGYVRVFFDLKLETTLRQYFP